MAGRRPIDLSMPTPRRPIGDILARFPELTFDWFEFLICFRSHEQLRAAAAERAGGSDRSSTQATEKVLVDWLQKTGALSVPAYAPLRSVSKLASIPFVTKGDLRRGGDSYRAPARPGEVLWKRATTGSTGPPITMVYSSEFYAEMLYLSPVKAALTHGHPLNDDREVYCLTIGENRQTPESLTVDPTFDRGVSMHVFIDTLQIDSILRVMHLINAVRPTCISSKPSVFELLCRYRVSSLTPPIEASPSLLISSGSMLIPSLRSLLERTFECPVADVYGMTEVGIISSTCTHGTMHVHGDCIVEAVDDDGELVSQGVPGEIVVSQIRNTAMPLVRYRTGDTGALRIDRCRCGTRGLQIVALGGRRIVCFRFSDGTVMTPTFFNDLFKCCPQLREFQMTQTAPDVMEVLVESTDHSARRHVQNTVRNFVRRAIPANVDVRVDSERFRPDSKFQRFRAPCWDMTDTPAGGRAGSASGE